MCCGYSIELCSFELPYQMLVYKEMLSGLITKMVVDTQSNWQNTMQFHLDILYFCLATVKISIIIIINNNSLYFQRVTHLAKKKKKANLP